MKHAIGGICLLWAGLASAGQYTVGVEALDYYPHYRSDAKGEFSGYARAVLDAFAKDAGHQFTYRPLPVNRLYVELIKGSIDFKYPDNAYWGGDAKKGATVLYSAPVTPYVDGLLVLPAKAEATDIKTIGSVIGFTPFDYKDGLASGKYKLEERTTLEQLLKGVLAGRIDSAYINVEVGQYALKSLGEGGKLVFNEKMPATRSNYHLSTIKQAPVLAEFDAWIKGNGDKVKAVRKEFGLDP